MIPLTKDLHPLLHFPKPTFRLELLEAEQRRVNKLVQGSTRTAVQDSTTGSLSQESEDTTMYIMM